MAARADNQRCNAPPYGGSVEKYKAFVDNYGSVIPPVKILTAACNAKFGGSDRTALYNLGITDSEISSKDTSDLAVQIVIALKKLVDKIN